MHELRSCCGGLVKAQTQVSFKGTPRKALAKMKNLGIHRMWKEPAHQNRMVLDCISSIFILFLLRK